MSTYPYTTTEESASVLAADTRTQAEKLVDKMLVDGGAFEQGAEYGVIERRVAVKLAEQRDDLLGALKQMVIAFRPPEHDSESDAYLREHYPEWANAMALVAKAEGKL